MNGSLMAKRLWQYVTQNDWSNFVAIEDDFYIGSFKSSARRFSFNKVLEVFTYD